MAEEHVDPVLKAMATLPEVDQERHMRELKDFLRSVTDVADAIRSGVLVAPFWQERLVDMFTSEAKRRERIGDPTHVVWAAWAKTPNLSERLQEMLPDEPA